MSFGDGVIVVPYGTLIDLSGGIGDVRYTVYTTENGASYIDQVNKFLSNRTADNFNASMLLVAQWINVCPTDDNQCSEVIN